jgi:hypothetical protein
MFTKKNLAFSFRNWKNVWVLGRDRLGMHLWFARMSLFWHWIATQNFKKWIATQNVRVNYNHLVVALRMNQSESLFFFYCIFQTRLINNSILYKLPTVFKFSNSSQISKILQNVHIYFPKSSIIFNSSHKFNYWKLNSDKETADPRIFFQFWNRKKYSRFPNPINDWFLS